MLVKQMLVDARAAAIRERDLIMSAIETGDHDQLSSLLHKLLPSAEEGGARPATGRKEGSDPGGEEVAAPVTLSMVEDLRLIGNQVLGAHLSKEAALEQVLEHLRRWRAELTHRARVERAAADGRDVFMEQYAVSHAGYVKKRGRNNTALRRRYFVLNEEELRYFKAQADVDQGLEPLGRMSCLGMHASRDRDDPRLFTVVDAEHRELDCESHDAEETKTWLEKIEAAALAAAIAHTRMREAGYFAKADIDGSGFIDFEEFCQMESAKGVGRDFLRKVATCIVCVRISCRYMIDCARLRSYLMVEMPGRDACSRCVP